MINNLIKWSLKNRLIVIVLGILLFIFGSISVVDTPVDVLPEFAPPQVVVITNAPGYAAEEVESIVTIPLESALNGISNLSAIRSGSIEGLSFITVVFDWGQDVYRARQLVAEKTQQVSQSFPQSVKAPILSPITSPIGFTYFFALTSKSTSLMELRSYADWEIKNKLLSVPGVASVLVYGGDLKQYQVLVNPGKLKQYNVTLNQVREAAELANVIVGGGYLLESDKEYLIRGVGKIKSIEDLGDSAITQNNGVPVYLKDVANVKLGAAFKRSYGSVNGKEAVYVVVNKQPWVNTVKLAQKIELALDDLKKTLPEDVKITKTFNQADFVNVSINNIIAAIMQGSILVIAILFIFLVSWRTSFISFTVIPLSLIVAILILKAFGQTINGMTLGGLAIAIGEIVDDAIIDVENIYKRLRQNKLSSNPKPVLEVIYDASFEVRHSVVYGTYIIVIVLLPVLFLSGIAKQLFAPLALAYITSLMASLFIALTLTPVMCFYLLSQNENLPEHESKINIKLKEKYLKLLDRVLKNPKGLFYSTVISALIAVSLFMFMGKAFLPELGEENLIMMVYTPPGSSLSLSQRIALSMEKALLKHPEVISVGNRAGRSETDDEPISSNLSHYDVTLKRGLSEGDKNKLIDKIRKEFEELPGVTILIRSFITETMENVLSGNRSPIVLKLYGSNLEILKQKASEIAKVLEKIKTLNEVEVEPIEDIPQIHINIKRKEAARYGLKVGDLLSTIQIAYNGFITSQKVIEEQKTFDIIVWFEKPYRKNIEVIKNTLIDTPAGIKVPLGQLAEIYESSGPNIINREEASRRIVIQANSDKKDQSKAVEKAKELIYSKVSIPEGYRLQFEGEYEQQKETNQKIFLLSALVLIGIYLLLSFAFKSLKVATIIMINLPFALIGGVIAVFLTSGVLSIASVVGFITLFGISTRNTILLVNKFHDIQQENQNLLIDQVIKDGALDRLIPILMTGLTAAFAMLPLALFPGAGREIEHPLAIVILGGMFSSTVLTLFVIPVVYKKFMK